MLEAVCAKPMRVLSLLHSRLRHVSESAEINSLKLVALLFSFPVFEAHNLLFKLSYVFAARRLRRAGDGKSMENVHDLLLQARS